MNTGSESNDLDREVDASMRMFEKSQVGSAAKIPIVRPARVLLALDGSPQDETGVNAANYFRERFNTETLVIDAREGEQEEDLAVPRAAQISGARPIQSKEEESYTAILASLKQHSVDLVIVPCPFGRPLEDVGTDSAGTVIDVLLSRCPKALLVIRRDDQQLSECMKNISMVIGDECEMEHRAAGWALGLAAEGASVALNLVVEQEQFENLRAILEAIQPETQLEPEQFSEALAKSHQSLHGGMAKTAAEMGFTYNLRPIAGEIAPPNPLDDTSDLLIVIPLEVDDRFEQGFTQDRIRRSPHPVLVVPGHVSEEAS
ncbi:MAG: universal stress protein [Planctomycetota bacterium]